MICYSIVIVFFVVTNAVAGSFISFYILSSGKIKQEQIK